MGDRGLIKIEEPYILYSNAGSIVKFRKLLIVISKCKKKFYNAVLAHYVKLTNIIDLRGKVTLLVL